MSIAALLVQATGVADPTIAGVRPPVFRSAFGESISPSERTGVSFLMARAKRFTAEQIVAKLREAEALQVRGATIPVVCKKLGISEQTFYRWRIKYGALKEDEAHRLKALEQENARLKKIVAEQALDISMLKEVSRGNF